MAVDPLVLADLLDEYAAALRRDRDVVAEQFGTAKQAFARVRGEYDWQNAREFKRRWQHTSDAFDAYTEGVHGLLQLLEERISALRDLGGQRL